MKIGQVISLHSSLDEILKSDKKYSPRFLFWARSTIQKTTPIFTNLKESIDGLKSDRLKEFEEKRQLLVEDISKKEKLSNEEKQKEFNEFIKPVMVEYDAEIKDFEKKVDDFESEILDEDAPENFSKIKFNEIPDLGVRELQMFFPLVDAKGKPHKKVNIPFKNILTLSQISPKAEFKNSLKYAIVSVMNSVQEQFDKFQNIKKEYNTHEQFGQYSIEKTQLHQNKTMSDEDFTKAQDDIHNRFSEVYSLEQELETIVESDLDVDAVLVPIDDLPETLSPAEFEVLEALVVE